MTTAQPPVWAGLKGQQLRIHFCPPLYGAVFRTVSPCLASQAGMSKVLPTDEANTGWQSPRSRVGFAGGGVVPAETEVGAGEATRSTTSLGTQVRVEGSSTVRDRRCGRSGMLSPLQAIVPYSFQMR